MSASTNKKILVPLLAFILVATLFLGFLFVFRSHDPEGERNFLSFSINPKESFKSVSLRLKSEGLISSEPVFYYMGRLTGKSASLKAGEYELNTQMSPWEILKVITGSHVKLYRITIPEGYTMFQIGELLEQAGLVDQVQFLEAAWDPAFVEDLNIPSFSVEGYLFPETYYIPRGSSPRAIIRLMVTMFWSKVPDSFLQMSKSSPFSFHEHVIMASMIEKETGLVGEMSLISSVFYNRLAKRMKIQSDPTAIYDTLPYGGKVTREDLLKKSPFNTYAIEGLPMSPICNPSFLALSASLSPQKTDYLYFVSRRDGSHQFSADYQSHQKAIEKFLKN